MQYKRFIVLPSYETNTYLVWDEISNKAIMIDPAAPDDILIREIEKRELELLYVVDTHGHGDHIAGNEMLIDHFGAELCIHRLDAEMLIQPNLNLSAAMGVQLRSKAADKLLEDDDELKLGNKILKVIHTPGHTKGGISLYVDDLLFSGDTLFRASIGRTDLPGGNFSEIKNSIRQKLFSLPDETKVLPGHGLGSTIGYEKVNNMFVGID